jgi:hypothetical protein
MGGLGSGRFHRNGRPGRKDVVEDCLALDANRLTRLGILRADLCRSDVLTWTDGRTGAALGSVGIAVDTTDPDDPWAQLSYAVGPTGEWIDDGVGLCTTQPHLGGLRWWFACPFVVGGAACGRRVGRLYLPPGERHFGCRRCHALTYTSCRESHAYDRLLRQMAVAADLSFEEAKRAFPTRPDPGWFWYPAEGRRRS